MDSTKAKNIVITFLCLLNAVLLILNIMYTDNYRYKMTNEQVKNISEALKLNNISLYGKLNRSFSPKSRLEMHPYEYDDELLKGIFMLNPDNAKLSIENNRQVYRTDWEALWVNVNTGYVAYRNRDITPGTPDFDYASGLCRDLIKKINALYSNFISDMPDDTPYQTDEGLVFEFRQTYKGYIINSNFILVTVGENGISRVEFMCARISGFSREKKSIYAEDQALLTCMYEIKNIYGDKAVSINQIDLVYHQQESNGTKNSPIYTTPFYRVYISESIEPILVNAYTNTVYITQ